MKLQAQIGDVADIAQLAVDDKTHVVSKLWHRSRRKIFWKIFAFSYTILIITAAVGAAVDVAILSTLTEERREILRQLISFCAILGASFLAMAARWIGKLIKDSRLNAEGELSPPYVLSALSLTLMLSVILGLVVGIDSRQEVLLSFGVFSAAFLGASSVFIIVSLESTRHPHIVLYLSSLMRRRGRWVVDDRKGLLSVVACMRGAGWQRSTVDHVFKTISTYLQHGEARWSSVQLSFMLVAIGVAAMGPAFQDLINLRLWPRSVFSIILLVSFVHVTLWLVNGKLRSLSVLKLIVTACTCLAVEMESEFLISSRRESRMHHSKKLAASGVHFRDDIRDNKGKAHKRAINHAPMNGRKPRNENHAVGRGRKMR